jgi:hypothetical protein
MTVTGPSTAINIPGAGDVVASKRKRGRPQRKITPTTLNEDNTPPDSSSEDESSNSEALDILSSMEMKENSPDTLAPVKDNSTKQKAGGKKGKKGKKGKGKSPPQTRRQEMRVPVPPPGSSPPAFMCLPPAPKKGIVKKPVESNVPLVEEAASTSPHITQWKIRFSVAEGVKKYIVEKQALPCLGKPMAIDPLEMNQEENSEGLWFIVRQDRSFSKPLPAQLKSLGNTRETRGSNQQQKSFTKSRPPGIPKRGQVLVECWLDEQDQPSNEEGKENVNITVGPTYIRELSMEYGVTSTGKIPLQLHSPKGEGEDNSQIVFGVRGGLLHLISIFVPITDIPATWQSSIPQNEVSEEADGDDGTQSPMKKKRKEEKESDEGEEKHKSHRVSFANDLSVRYYIGPITCKRSKKSKGGPSVDRCADVKINASEKLAVTKQTRAKLHFHPLSLGAVPGSAGSPQSSPSKPTRTGAPRVASTSAKLDFSSSPSPTTSTTNSSDSPLSPDLSYSAEEMEAALRGPESTSSSTSPTSEATTSSSAITGTEEEFVDIDGSGADDSITTATLTEDTKAKLLGVS